MNLDDTSGNLRLDRNHFAGDKLADGVEINGNILSERGSDGYRRRRAFESRLGLFAAAHDEESGKQDRNERTIDQMVMVSYHDVLPASAEKSTATPRSEATGLNCTSLVLVSVTNCVYSIIHCLSSNSRDRKSVV